MSILGKLRAPSAQTPSGGYTTDLENTVAKLRAQIADLELDRRILEAIRKDDIADALWWLQRKTVRQRKALDKMNRKVVTQRFYLRIMNRLREPLTGDEYRAARDAEPGQLRERIDEEGI